ncbi:MAG: hypothetical protein MMC23_002982 [Stictis urceolatum]|nr:hypothetical protein [Stictis urceolata]
MASVEANDKHAKPLQKLTSTLYDYYNIATFACGGHIPILSHRDGAENLTLRTTSKVRKQLVATEPVTIRFGAPGTGDIVRFPCSSEDDPSFQALVATYQPATSGLQGKDVYDESYHKATKLDTSDFCADFCPCSFGIINRINQLLLSTMDEYRGVRAELDKLNVYTGPSRHFTTHVDTPRDLSQFGFLVVALPTKFDGGALLVRNTNGNTVTFDWAKDNMDAPSIQ